MLLTYTYLIVAIAFEVVGTSALKASDGFSKLWPSIISVTSYGLAIFLLSLTLRTLPTGIAYAIWSGVGIIFISAVGWVWFKQPLDTAAIIGLGMIIAGVVIVNVFSTSIPH